MTSFRTALLTIRAWMERGSEVPLRARIRVSTDVSRGYDRSSTVSTPEAGAELVRGWLEEIRDAPESEEDPAPTVPPEGPTPVPDDPGASLPGSR